ncbi:plasmid pRiA4b ORF-3 family protein [Sphingopyxis sp. MG]|uniref:plasmid pRiA4b ORF-3 family protein n=1 Tax=Sphingopyxis sp. MG TaxID=1866325 RepID=UPI0018F878F7|nr:plasmid pRiA4b ORF-3 family protein [Sphingopyxis sp. MG]
MPGKESCPIPGKQRPCDQRNHANDELWVIESLTGRVHFGDNWRHRIEIEEISSTIPGTNYPRFVDGERRAPPEDVGGTPGFEEFLEAMSKPRHPERKSMIEWYGRPFDPADISPDEISACMAKLAKRRAQGKAAYADAKSRDS